MSNKTFTFYFLSNGETSKIFKQGSETTFRNKTSNYLENGLKEGKIGKK